MKHAAKTLRNVAKELLVEADNISPTMHVHPAPAMRQWAAIILIVANELDHQGAPDDDRTRRDH